jgi:hypothetical protein
VIAQRWKYIVIAELNLESLRFTQEQILRHVRQMLSSAQGCKKRRQAVRDQFRRLDAGVLSLPRHPCTCAMSAGNICLNCRGLSVSERRFVV